MDIMDASGVALVLIGPGSIDQVYLTYNAKSFSEKSKFEGEIYADPTHLSYEALNFVSGVLTTFTPNAGLKIIQLYLEGYRQHWKLSFEKDTVSRGGWTKKQGMTQKLKISSKHVAREERREGSPLSCFIYPAT
ncbi:thioredoxin-like protein AAED1, chloroplastic isoform X1 [Glycine max]|uniref:thioredoxin-like protein AAED1, chloroplastic isoform X1 n=1 Tax=Glycine max TaxID=3847 RepID=UPI000E21BB2A|nr:thioredoxin-like protein AAED1, chloroplastic isoform X1 [Glycine max]XP_040870047.1 thioredoxin-like protein AAED1, chloroplastic isoform X1 [Glycine max]|eukprot:XP_025983672.1 thioredoxin-like protein AAED1, chloroplastic isoform X1 [Glycine max]